MFLRNQHVRSSLRQIHRDFDCGEDNCCFDDNSSQLRSFARTIAVLTTIRRNYDRKRERQHPEDREGEDVKMGGNSKNDRFVSWRHASGEESSDDARTNDARIDARTFPPSRALIRLTDR